MESFNILLKQLEQYRRRMMNNLPPAWAEQNLNEHYDDGEYHGEVVDSPRAMDIIGKTSAYYHVTPRSNRESIQEYGVDPNYSDTWRGQDYPYIWAWDQDHYQRALDWGAASPRPMDIWHINPEGIIWQPDPHASDPDEEGWYKGGWAAARIPPENLIHVEEYTEGGTPWYQQTKTSIWRNDFDPNQLQLGFEPENRIKAHAGVWAQWLWIYANVYSQDDNRYELLQIASDVQKAWGQDKNFMRGWNSVSSAEDDPEQAQELAQWLKGLLDNGEMFKSSDYGMTDFQGLNTPEQGDPKFDLDPMYQGQTPASSPLSELLRLRGPTNDYPPDPVEIKPPRRNYFHDNPNRTEYLHDNNVNTYFAHEEFRCTSCGNRRYTEDFRGSKQCERCGAPFREVEPWESFPDYKDHPTFYGEEYDMNFVSKIGALVPEVGSIWYIDITRGNIPLQYIAEVVEDWEDGVISYRVIDRSDGRKDGIRGLPTNVTVEEWLNGVREGFIIPAEEFKERNWTDPDPNGQLNLPITSNQVADNDSPSRYIHIDREDLDDHTDPQLRLQRLEENMCDCDEYVEVHSLELHLKDMKEAVSRKRFLCMDCGIDTGKIAEHYALNDETWDQVHDSNKGMLCVGCLEGRLGRPLTPHDFNDSYINSPRFEPKSQRLMDRMRFADIEQHEIEDDTVYRTDLHVFSDPNLPKLKELDSPDQQAMEQYGDQVYFVYLDGEISFGHDLEDALSQGATHNMTRYDAPSLSGVIDLNTGRIEYEGEDMNQDPGLRQAFLKKLRILLSPRDQTYMENDDQMRSDREIHDVSLH